MNPQFQTDDVSSGGDIFHPVEDQIADLNSILQDTYHRCTTLHDELIAENWRIYVLGRIEETRHFANLEELRDAATSFCFERSKDPTLNSITPRDSKCVETAHLEILLENLNRGHQVCRDIKNRIDRYPEFSDDGFLIFHIWYRLHCTLEEHCDFYWFHFRKRKAQVLDLMSKTIYE